MGCGASKLTPVQQFRKDITELRQNIPQGCQENVAKCAEARYLETSVGKIDKTMRYMGMEVMNRQKYHDDLMDIICERDADLVKEASEGMGTDEAKMGIVVMRSTEEMLRVTDKFYQQKYGRTLEDQIRGENKSMLGLLTGSLTDFGRFLVYRCQDSAERDAFLLHKSMAGVGCSDYILCEILSTRTNDELKRAAIKYQEAQGEDMQKRIMKETGGFGKKWYGKWVDSLVEFNRNEVEGTPETFGDEGGEHAGNDWDANIVADILYKAGEAKWMGCDEQPFIDHLCKANRETLDAIIHAYDKHPKSKKTLAKAIEDKMGGDLEFAVLARVLPRMEFFAKRLYKACKGLGTDEECIGRVMACLSKVDAMELPIVYNRMFGNEKAPLNDFHELLRSELSGDFLRALLEFVDVHPPKASAKEGKHHATESDNNVSSFGLKVEEAYNSEAAITLGKTDLNGPLTLIGFPAEELFLNADLLLQASSADAEIPVPVLSDHSENEFMKTEENIEELEDEERLEEIYDGLEEIWNGIDSLNGEKDTVIEEFTEKLVNKAKDLRRGDAQLKILVEDCDAMRKFCEENGLADKVPGFQSTPI